MSCLPARSATQHVGEVAGDRDRIIVVKRGDWVVDVEIFVRLVGNVAIKHPLADGHKEAPDEDVLLATRDLDIRRLTFAERDLPIGVVDIEVEVGIAIEVAGNRFVQRKVFQTIEETGIWVELEMPDGVAFQIVVPGE